MPTYVYACKSCGHRFEQYQSFSDDSLVTCPSCSEDALRKVFNSVGIVFKGPGFYSTDSISSATASSGPAKTDSTSGSDSSSSGAAASTGASTSASSDSAPAAAAS